MNQVKINPNCTVKYWTYHDDQQPTIIMIHGFTGSHEGFQYIEPLLGEYRLIIPDVPGFGESTIGRSDWSVDSIAKLLNKFVQQLGFQQPPHLLGHSMGGLIAAAMIDHHLTDQAKRLMDLVSFALAGVAAVSLTQTALIISIIAGLASIILAGFRVHDRLKYGPMRGRE